jgi:hypothetical protein
VRRGLAAKPGMLTLAANCSKFLANISASFFAWAS